MGDSNALNDTLVSKGGVVVAGWWEWWGGGDGMVGVVGWWWQDGRSGGVVVAGWSEWWGCGSGGSVWWSCGGGMMGVVVMVWRCVSRGIANGECGYSYSGCVSYGSGRGDCGLMEVVHYIAELIFSNTIFIVARFLK